MDVPTDVLEEIRVFVAVPGAIAETLDRNGQGFKFVIRDTVSGRTAWRGTHFRRP